MILPASLYAPSTPLRHAARTRTQTMGVSVNPVTMIFPPLNIPA